MGAVPADFADLCGAPHFAHLVTVNPNGGPQSTVVWFRPEKVEADGSVSQVLFSTGYRYRKAKNMQREPRVSLSIHDADDPYRTLEIVGRAELRPRTTWDTVDAISNSYTGRDYPLKSEEGARGWDAVVHVERAICHPNENLPESLPKPAAGTDLLEPPHFSHVATIGPDGRPRSSVVWHRRAQGGGPHDIEFWTGAGTLKTRHLRSNPRIAVSIHDEADPYRYVELLGEAEITAVDNHDLLDALTPRYWKADRYPAEEPMSGVEIRVRTRNRISDQG